MSSSFNDEVQEGFGEDLVAPCVFAVRDVAQVTEKEDSVMGTAPVHSSFAGACALQKIETNSVK